MRRRGFLCFLALPLLAGCPSSTPNSTPATGSATGAGGGGDKLKIGFVVKSASEPWFQTEWKFAQQAADKYGFELVKLPATDAEELDRTLSNLANQGAKGVVLCTPDTKLGPTVVAKCKEKNLKLFTVDDRLLDATGKPMTEVHYLGISATEIGKMVGQAIADEAKKRGWNPAEVGIAALTVDEIETCKERTDGATEVLLKNGFLEKNLFKNPWKKPQDIPAAVDAANTILAQHTDIKKWVAFSSNDDGVLGFVRASEQKNILAENVIGIGINGTTAKDDFAKAKPTGMFASVLLSAKTHGYSTAEMMYQWIKDGKEPPKETFTKGVLIDRTNYKEKLKEEGIE
ncbi:MAG: arabinose ABC transporter substrate-binding protein [Armatimonas sp.]